MSLRQVFTDCGSYVITHILSLFNKNIRNLKPFSSGNNTVAETCQKGILKFIFFFARNILKINIHRTFVISKSISSLKILFKMLFTEILR